MSNGTSKDLCCIVRIVDTRWELPPIRFFFTGYEHVGNRTGKSKFSSAGSNTVDVVSGFSGSRTVEVATCIQ